MNISKEIESAKQEVSANYKYFENMLPEWRGMHLAEFALIHKQELVAFFESEHDAIQVGMKDYGLGYFSVQAVQNVSADLGHQSNALF